jgi:hypothetical protein
MSDKDRQMASDMYYFAPRSCAIFIDSKTSLRLYFALVIRRERRRRKTVVTQALLVCRRAGATQKGLQLMLPWGHR